MANSQRYVGQPEKAPKGVSLPQGVHTVGPVTISGWYPTSDGGRVREEWFGGRLVTMEYVGPDDDQPYVEPSSIDGSTEDARNGPNEGEER